MNPHNGFVSNRVLKLNVGFLLNESIGTSRDFTFDVPELGVTDDLRLLFLRGVLRLSRTSEGILVQGTLQTAIPAECARCLNQIPIEVPVDIEELFAQSPHAGSEFFVGEDGILDLAPLLREEVLVSVPMAPACQLTPDRACPFGHSLDSLEPYLRREDEIDPRFAILQQLRDQDRDSA